MNSTLHICWEMVLEKTEVTFRLNSITNNCILNLSLHSEPPTKVDLRNFLFRSHLSPCLALLCSRDRTLRQARVKKHILRDSLNSRSNSHENYEDTSDAG
jgi:hypothetical protein